VHAVSSVLFPEISPLVLLLELLNITRPLMAFGRHI
jgi:hypothetical protein